jgi:F-type H+-transporting ATPase subunit a
VPGLAGSTSSADTTWAWATISWVVHQYVGIKEHGFGYIKHFLGPSLFDVTIGGRKIHVRLLAPLYALIEMLSHISRAFTLAVRLLGTCSRTTSYRVWMQLVPPRPSSWVWA